MRRENNKIVEEGIKKLRKETEKNESVLASLQKRRMTHETIRMAADVYLAYLKSPYYKFFRDTLSYIIMLLLHYAICLSPTTVAFSGLEWTILVFYIGRFVAELKQILCIKKWLRETENDTFQSNCVRIFSVYCSDCWNRFDFASLVFYIIILILRIVTWFNDGSVANNRALAIAGYLYSLNTLCLTLRTFGQVMEQPKDVGTIQIALFSILRDVRTVLWQFLAVILAFSIAITKIYMSERSFIANESVRHKIWWAMFSHLGWSLLDRSEESGPMISVDPSSVLLARIFYAAFLIMGVVLLINMLIALLSSTYQKTEENAVREWSFKRAITIQTYNGYDPIPVPLNIIYRIYRLLRLCTKKVKKEEDNALQGFVKDLEVKYFREHANSFPVTDATKGDRVLRETERNRQMISQILYKTFSSSNGDRRTPIHEWDPNPGIQIEGPLVTCDCTEECFPDPQYHHHGARYRQPLSREFPHFEITIVETGEYKWLAIGITNEAYKTSEMPGWYEESLGYHTDDGNIFHNTKNLEDAIGTKGPAMARRGDRIGCTVLFEERRDADGKIPVFFTLNGSEIILEGGESPGKSLIFVDFEKPLFPVIGMTVGSRVLAKMCVSEDELQKDMSKVFDHIIYAREDVVRQSLEIQELKSDFADVRQEMNAKEDNMRHNMEDIVCNEVKKATKCLEDIVSNEVKKAMKCLEEKLDALLVKLSEKDN
ncbi:unnamed protein product [Porites evermanni]|uniref:Uncharacterized protein n=1 Tax=Porites evermanni TaxID=104178 RepID=A0ABN8QDW9_9CNID|nr:unnamed protein product [Porites evermanni]